MNFHIGFIHKCLVSSKNNNKNYVERITYFFFDTERSDFWLRLLFAEVFDLREESK